MVVCLIESRGFEFRLESFLLNHNGWLLAIEADEQFTRKRNGIKDLVPVRSLYWERNGLRQRVECMLHLIPYAKEAYTVIVDKVQAL